MAVCRFCKKHASESDLLKYSVRHYAHHACFFEFAPNPLDSLHDWQIRNTPALILKQHELLDHPRVRKICAEIDREIQTEKRAASYGGNT